MERSSGQSALIDKHRNFLNLKETDRPLFTTRESWDCRPPPFLADTVGEGGLVRPEDLNPEPFLDWYETILERHALVPDDGIRPANPYFSIPWMEAMLGCPVRAYSTTLYPEPFLECWDSTEDVNFSLENPWFEKLIEFTARMVGRFGTRFPICMASLRGPGDMVASLRGRQEICLALYDKPTEIEALAARCARMWIQVAKRVLEIIPPYAGGYVNRFQVWTPGTTSVPHIDFSSLISREMFQQFLLVGEREIVKSFDYPIYHAHESSLHVADDLLEMENVAAIQISLDQPGPPRPKLIEILARMQQRKPIIVQGSLGQSEIAELADALSPRGLWLTFVVETLQEAQESIAWARKRWSIT